MRFLIVIFLVICIIPVFCQDVNSDPDKVSLKGGQILLGKIVFEDDQILMLSISGSDEIISINQSDIFSKIKHSGEHYYYERAKFDYLKGNYLLISPGAGVGQGGSTHLNMLIAWRLTPRFALGPGIGYLSLSTQENFTSHQFVDTYVYSRYWLSRLRKPNKWFLSTQAGYALPAGKNRPGHFSYSGGPMGEIGFGLHWSSKKRTKCSLQYGYRVHVSRGKIQEPIFIQIEPQEIFSIEQMRIFIRNLVRLNIELN